VTDRVLEEIRRYVITVPPASTAVRDAARQSWEALAAASGGFAARPELTASADVMTPEQPSGGRGFGGQRRLDGTRRRPLRLSAIVAVACLLAVSLVAGIAVDRHLGRSSGHPGPAFAAPASCSKGPIQLTVVDPVSGHGPYPLVAPYEFVVLRPVTKSGVPVSGLAAGRSAAVFVWRNGAWRPEAPLPVPAPGSGAARGRAIVQFTNRYPTAAHYLLQVPFNRTGAANPIAPTHSLMLCTTVVIAPPSPGVTTTEAG
jgi:hypothetical protein